MTSPVAHAPPMAATAGKGIPSWARLGVIFGVVSAASIALWAPIGVSGTYPRFIGAILRRVLKPETFLVIGLLIGGFLASRINREASPKTEMVHAGEKTVSARYRDAFLGGFLIIFGARIAGGCTSGHIISGITQLSVSGLIFAAGVFASGIFTAKMLNAGGR